MVKSENSLTKEKGSLGHSNDYSTTKVKKLKACKKQKRDGILRKAPQAPRRFKSSYILFFMAKQDEIKRSLPSGSSVSFPLGINQPTFQTNLFHFSEYIIQLNNIIFYYSSLSPKVGDVSKKSSQLWKSLPAEERAYWDERADQDKQRYLREKDAYTGPWQVPYKRAKKVSLEI